MFKQSCCHNEKHFRALHGCSFTVYTGLRALVHYFIQTRAGKCIKVRTCAQTPSPLPPKNMSPIARGNCAQHMHYTLSLWVHLVHLGIDSPVRCVWLKLCLTLKKICHLYLCCNIYEISLLRAQNLGRVAYYLNVSSSCFFVVFFFLTPFYWGLFLLKNYRLSLKWLYLQGVFE